MQDELKKIAVDTLKELAEGTHYPAQVRLEAAVQLLEIAKAKEGS